MLLLVANTHPLSGLEEVPLSAFSRDSFICNNAGFDTRVLLQQQCQLAGFQPNIVFDGNEPELASKLVADNYGVMLMSSIVYQWMMGMEIINPPLHYITALHIADPVCQRPLGLAVLNNHYVSRTTARFIDGLKAYFENLSQ